MRSAECGMQNFDQSLLTSAATSLGEGRKKHCHGSGFSATMGQLTRMSIATLTRPDAPQTSAAVERDFLLPVARRNAGTFQLLSEVLRHGGPGYLQFAITNICND